MKSRHKVFIVIFFGTIICLSIIGLLCLALFQNRQPQYGATFSASYAQYLGLDAEQVFAAAIDELGIEDFRIPVYWSELEPMPGKENFTQIDTLMNHAALKNARITLVIGEKVLRWPECYLPEWTDYISDTEKNAALLRILKHTVERYKDHPALTRWQVENEPYFPFGECDRLDPQLLAQEIDLVRSLDSYHEIQLTTSGEQSLWLNSVDNADILGVSLYRQVWSPVTGSFVFPYSSLYYGLQRVFTEFFVEQIIISELQVEPWLGNEVSLTDESISSLSERFTATDFLENVRFAKRTGVREIYFWGIEWWYFLKENGDQSLWQAGRELIDSSKN